MKKIFLLLFSITAFAQTTTTTVGSLKMNNTPVNDTVSQEILVRNQTDKMVKSINKTNLFSQFLNLVPEQIVYDGSNVQVYDPTTSDFGILNDALANIHNGITTPTLQQVTDIGNEINSVVNGVSYKNKVLPESIEFTMNDSLYSNSYRNTISSQQVYFNYNGLKIMMFSGSNPRFKIYKSGSSGFSFELQANNITNDGRQVKVEAPNKPTGTYTMATLDDIQTATPQVSSDWNATTGVAHILNKPTLSAVAISGSYIDLSNKPTIPTVPTVLSGFTNDLSFKTVGGTSILGSGNISLPTVPTVLSGFTNDTGFITSSAIANKVDKITGKGLSTEDYTTAEKTKVSNLSGTNTGDQTTTDGLSNTTDKNLLTDTQLTKVNAIDQAVSTTEKATWNAKQNALGFTPENVANKQTDLTASATNYPTVNAVNNGLATKATSINDLSGSEDNNIVDTYLTKELGYFLCTKGQTSFVNTLRASNITVAGSVADNLNNDIQCATTTTAGTLAYQRGFPSTNVNVIIRQFAFGVVSNNARFFCGSSYMYGVSNPTNIEPNVMTNSIGICKLSTSNNLQFISNDGSGTATIIDCGVNFPANSTLYKYVLEIKVNSASSTSVYLKRITISDGTSILTSNTFITDLPVNSQYPAMWICNNTTSAINSYYDYGCVFHN